MELTKERMQQIWDYELIRAWDEKGRKKMWMVVHNFMCKVKGQHEVGSVSFEDTEDYLVSLGLKRCLDIDHTKGYHVFCAWRTDVIGFVHSRCEELSLALMDDDAIKPLILMDIDSYKWTKSNARASAKFNSEKSRDKKVNQQTKTIKARDLDGRSNWSKVK